MLNFDEYGFLTPNKVIQSTYEELVDEFVNNIPSENRKDIFNKYVNYSKELKKLCNDMEIKQWINGSFTTKKSNPNDIDFISFIEFSIFEQNVTAFSKFSYPNSMINFGVDAYLVIVYPIEDVLYFNTKSDTLHWLHQFCQTATNKRGIKKPKGFLEIIFKNY